MVATAGWLRWVGRAAAEAGLLIIVPCALILARYFSWGAGPYRLLSLALVFGFVAISTRRRGYLASVWDHRPWHRLLQAACIGLLALHVPQFVDHIRRGGECWTDMGRPSICAGEWLLRGLNPWADRAPPLTAAERRAPPPSEATYVECVKFDRFVDYKAGGSYRDWSHHGSGFDFMDGYKYGPIALVAYLPLTHTLRERGLFIVNFAFWWLQAAMMWLLARAAYPQQPAASSRALIGLLLPLVLPLYAWLPPLHLRALGRNYNLEPPERDTFILEVTQRCSNDIIPVALALCALFCLSRRRVVFSGVLLGLSLAAKPLPGLLWSALMPGLAPGRARGLIATAVLTTTVCYLPFFVWAPREMIANLIAFGWLRPTNASSIRAYIPATLGDAVSALQFVACAAVVFLFYRAGPRDLPRLLRSAALATAAFVALNKVVHGNYFLWIQPVAALAVAGLPFRATMSGGSPSADV